MHKINFLLYKLELVFIAVAGKLLVWGGKLAHRRGDMHEFEHMYAALAFGNTEDCQKDHSECMLDYYDREEESEIDMSEWSKLVGEWSHELEL